MTENTAETEEKKKLSPTHTAEDVGPCKLKLHIEVSAEKVKEQIDDKYRELGEGVALPGFRKGHAPRNLLERKFGKALLEDLRFELVNQSFDEVKEEKKLEPVGDPDLDPEKLTIEEGKPFAYDVTVEVRPTFELKSFEGIKIKKPAVTVEDREIELVLKNFQESKAELVPTEGAPAAPGDHLTVDFTLEVDGKKIDTAENNAFFLAADLTFYGAPMPDFVKAVTGRKVGDTVEHPIKLPDTYTDKAHAGKNATLKAAIKSVKRKKLPELDAAFAKAFDVESVDELKDLVRKRLEREKEVEGRSAMADQVIDQILKDNEFPMPEGLVSAGTEEAIRKVHLDLATRGLPEEEIHKALEKEKGPSREGMLKSLKTHFILENIARKERLFVTEDQIEERIGVLAARYGKWPHEMKANLEERGLLSQLRRQMRDDMVREFLLSKAVIE